MSLRYLIIISILCFICLPLLAQDQKPAAKEAPPSPKKLSSGEIYDLGKIVRAWKGVKSRNALKDLVQDRSKQAFNTLVRIATDSNEIKELRLAILRALSKSKDDQAGLYIMDCHKVLREEFSQSRLALKLKAGYRAFYSGCEAWAAQKPGEPPTKEFGKALQSILSGKVGGDLSIIALFALKDHPYQQVIDYLREIGLSGGSLERVTAAFALASLRGGVGMPTLGKVLEAKECPDMARLAAYVLLIKGYGKVKGSSVLVLERLKKEGDPRLAMYLIKGVGQKAGREVMPELDAALSRHPRLKGVIGHAQEAISVRHPSEWKWLIGVISIIGVIGLTVLAVNFLRMPPVVIEKLYLEETNICDVEVQLAECDMAQVLQAVVRVDRDCFERFARVSLIYEGQGEIAFRERSMCIADDPPYNYVGGGTIIDDWYWNQGRPGRVLANWFFDFKRYEDTTGKIPILIGVLFRGDDFPPTIKLKVAGVKPNALAANAVVQDRTFSGRVVST